MNKDQQNYIEHEVKIRLHDAKFQLFEKSIDYLNATLQHLDNKIDTGLKHLDNKLTSAIRIFIAISVVGYMIPIALHFMKLS
jgi:hypothetical protein